MFEPPAYLSPSSINTFRDCPQKYKLSRIDGIPEPPTWATTLGTFVHGVLENLYQLDAADRTVETLKTLAADVWAREEWESKVSTLANAPGTTRDFKVEAFRCMTNLWKLEDPREVELDGMEHEVIADVDGVTMKGYIDRFILADDGSIVISDYKTGKIPNPRFKSDDEKFFQLLAYALMLESSDQETTSKVQLYYLKQPVIHEIEATPVSLSVAKGTIVETREALESACSSGKFHANTGKLCDWCYYKASGHCPAFS